MTLTRTARLAVLFAAPALAGCGAGPVPADPPEVVQAAAADAPQAAPAPAKPRAARPDATRLGYAPASRVLTLYALPDPAARWMLALPGRPAAVPVDTEYEFPPAVPVELDQVAVFYAVPGSPPSPAVTLQEIVDARSRRAGL